MEWYNYLILETNKDLKDKQIRNLKDTELLLDDSGACLSYLETPDLEKYEKNCEELYNHIFVSDHKIALCDEIFYTTKIEGAHTTRKRTMEIHNGATLNHTNYDSEKMVQNGFHGTKFLGLVGEQINENNIRKLWEIITDQVCENKDIAGELYRTGDVQIGNILGLEPCQIKPAMDHWIEYYNSEIDNDKPFLKSALLHYAFERIHPFCDGNGRVGRMLANNYLINHGFEKIKGISFSAQIGKTISDYYDSLDKSGNYYFDCTPFLQYMTKTMNQVLADVYLTNNLSNFKEYLSKEDIRNCSTIEDANKLIEKVERILPVSDMLELKTYKKQLKEKELQSNTKQKEINDFTL